MWRWREHFILSSIFIISMSDLSLSCLDDRLRVKDVTETAGRRWSTPECRQHCFAEFYGRHALKRFFSTGAGTCLSASLLCGHQTWIFPVSGYSTRMGGHPGRMLLPRSEVRSLFEDSDKGVRLVAVVLKAGDSM